MGKFEGKVVLVSGVARGQGRSHAVRFAEQGASIIGFDVCQDMASVPYSLATRDDLEETERMVKAAGGAMVSGVADVRDTAAVTDVVNAGVQQFGRLDIVMANAGIVGNVGPIWELDDKDFQDVIDINLVGAWRTLKVAVPHLLNHTGQRSAVITSSGMGVKAAANIGHYTSSKHGVIGLMRTYAKELAPHGVRVNAILPGNTNTDMLRSQALMRLYVPEEESPTLDQYKERASQGIPMASRSWSPRTSPRPRSGSPLTKPATSPVRR